MDFPELLRVLQVVFGIGLVIFVHEAGHFIAARICKVDVQVFSLGFGPPLLSLRRGKTVYQVAIVPLGGYVKMAGDEPTEEGRAWARRQERDEALANARPDEVAGAGGPRPGDLYSKSVGARFFIYSGGVLMNLAFGLVVFPILFAKGVPFKAPLITPVPGGPAWHARIAPGSEVLAIDGDRVFEFTHIPNAVALGDPEGVELTLREPGSETPRNVYLVPERDEELGLNRIGVRPSIDPELRLAVQSGSPAWRAGLRAGMRLLSVEGGTPDQTPIERMADVIESGEPMVVTVAGDEGTATYRVEPEESEQERDPYIGIAPPSNWVDDIRQNDLIASIGIESGDILRRVGETAILRRRDLHRALADRSGPVAFLVERAGATLELEAPPLESAEAVSIADDIALAAPPESTEVTVVPGWAADEAGLRDGDVITRINGVEVATWEDVQRRVSDAGKRGTSVRLSVTRRGATPDERTAYLELDATPRASSFPMYGLAVQPATSIFQASGPIDAIVAGMSCSWRFVVDSWITIRHMLSGQVSSKNMGGIIMISQVSYSWSQEGLPKLFYFLCMLSINLAILNVLPIPVLDGGHLFFLLIEKLKGSPVDDRVLGYSQMIGLVLILSLMVYVTYNDLTRTF